MKACVALIDAATDHCGKMDSAKRNLMARAVVAIAGVVEYMEESFNFLVELSAAEAREAWDWGCGLASYLDGKRYDWSNVIRNG